MPPSGGVNLEELLRQREAVARHLAWLDAQIHRLQERDDYAEEDAFESEVDQSIDNVTELGPFGRQRAYGLSVGDKAGCIGILVFLALLFLAALYILPNLIYN